MDVKNKVDENVDEKVVKEDAPTKPNADASDVFYSLGELAGYIKGTSDSEKYIKKANIKGMFEGAACFAAGQLIGQILWKYLFNKNHK